MTSWILELIAGCAEHAVNCAPDCSASIATV